MMILSEKHQLELLLVSRTAVEIGSFFKLYDNLPGNCELIEKIFTSFMETARTYCLVPSKVSHPSASYRSTVACYGARGCVCNRSRKKVSSLTKESIRL